MTIRHVVVWKLATDDAEVKAEQAAKIAASLVALATVIPQIASISAGAEALYAENADVALVADFADRAALEAYQQHPAHQEVGAYIRSVVSDRVAVDFEL